MKPDEKLVVAFKAIRTVVSQKLNIAGSPIRSIGDEAKVLGYPKSFVTQCLIFDSS